MIKVKIEQFFSDNMITMLISLNAVKHFHENFANSANLINT
jgi:hypothetical protein